MKTYVLTVSRTFPKTHKRAGEQTFFPEMILSALGKEPQYKIFNPKLHTIRANYERWAKQAEVINRGEAILSVRYWSDVPYRSKQVEICQLTKIGVQKIFIPNPIYILVDGKKYDWVVISKNDGLSF